MARPYRVRRVARHDAAAVRTIHIDGGKMRIYALKIFFLVCAGAIGVRLFGLMVAQHGFFTALASDSHEIYAELTPERGGVYLENAEEKLIPLAINRDKFVVFADTRGYEDPKQPLEVATSLAEFFGYDDERKFKVLEQLQKQNDAYEQIEKNVDEDTKKRLEERKLPGIHFSRFRERFYPEGALAAPVVGFVGKTENGTSVGRYGVEGYWNSLIGGTGGVLEGIRSASGAWIPLAGRSFERATDGADVILTLDRTLQYEICERLKNAVSTYQAQSGSMVIMDPLTGAIIVMCSVPDFDPNEYNKVTDISTFNNLSIFEPYEPGSVFKPITMAAALDMNVIKPDDYFYDSGSVEAGCKKPIQNADNRSYKDQNMSGILERSINTGVVFIANKLGKENFRQYVEKFGFGTKTGIELDTENPGTIASLYQNKGDKVDCYTATASFGQGITATPLQLVTAFSAIANGGKMMKPYIVKRIEYANGKVETIRPTEIRQVISKHTADTVAAMMVRVVDYSEGKRGQVPGYYIAGKTGTAQIAGPGGYTAETNHSFIGFGPVGNPKFVTLIRLEKPQRTYANITAAPLFAEITSYLLSHYHIPPER